MTTYFITGCGRGIGRALTEHLLDRGDRVVGSIRSGAPPLTHERFSTVRFDVRRQEEIDTAVEGIYGGVDVLVNNAGIPGPEDGRTFEIDTSGFADVLDVNVLGPIRVLRALMPLLRKSPQPKVMTVSSQLGSMAYPVTGHVAYCTSKAALNKLMQAVAGDLKKDRIPLVIAHPGWVRTDMGGPSAPLSPEESARGLAGLIDDLTLETTGRFIDWDGSPREW